MKESNINLFKKVITTVLLIASGIEIVLFPSVTTFIVILIILVSWSIATKVLLNKRNITFYPISSFIIICYVVFYIIMPLIATLIEGKEVIYNLKNSELTFLHIFLIFLCLLIAFSIYKKFSRLNFIRPFFIKFQFFRRFRENEIWLLAAFSFIIVVTNILLYGNWNEELDSQKPTILRLLAFFAIFINIPILFLFPQFKLIKNYTKIKYKKIVVVYIIVLFIVGIASNVRTLAVTLISFYLFIFFFLWLRDDLTIKIKPANFIIISILSVSFISIFSDLSLAMVMTRGQRGNLTGMELLDETYKLFQDKERLHNYKVLLTSQENQRSQIDWDERYLDNDLLARFCSIKTIDETIYYAGKIGYGNKTIQNDYKRQSIAILPEFVAAKIFNMSPKERDEITSYSETDYLYALASHDYNGLGSFKIGSLAGLGLAIFSYWYLPLIIIIFSIIFYMTESSIIVLKNGQNIFSLWAFSNILLFGYFTSAGHNFHTEVKFIFRAFFESIFFYLISIRLVNFFVPNKK